MKKETVIARLSHCHLTMQCSVAVTVSLTLGQESVTEANAKEPFWKPSGDDPGGICRRCQTSSPLSLLLSLACSSSHGSTGVAGATSQNLQSLPMWILQGTHLPCESFSRTPGRLVQTVGDCCQTHASASRHTQPGAAKQAD